MAKQVIATGLNTPRLQHKIKTEIKRVHWIKKASRHRPSINRPVPGVTRLDSEINKVFRGLPRS